MSARASAARSGSGSSLFIDSDWHERVTPSATTSPLGSVCPFTRYGHSADNPPEVSARLFSAGILGPNGRVDSRPKVPKSTGVTKMTPTLTPAVLVCLGGLDTRTAITRSLPMFALCSQHFYEPPRQTPTSQHCTARHTPLRSHLAESRLQADSPSTRDSVYLLPICYQIWYDGRVPKKPTRRQYGTGSVTWLTPYKALLRVVVDGQRYSKSVKTHHKDRGGRGEATEALTKFTDELEAKEGDMSRTLKKAIKEYRAVIDVRPSTLESYENAAKRISPEMLSTPINKFEPHDLDLFYRALSQDYAPATVRHTAAFLRAVFGQAEVWGWVTDNPTRKTRKIKAQPTARRQLEPADVRTLIDASPDLVTQMAITLGAITGCRRGELCGLRWEDYDPKARTLRVERQWVPGKGGQHLGVPKSVGNRVVHLDEDAVAVIDRYRVMQARTTVEEGWILSDDGVTPLRAKSLTEAISKLAKDNGLEGATTHSIRQMTASELMAAEVDPAAAALRMGHTTQVMVDRYVKAREDRGVAAAGALSARLTDRGLPIAELLKEAQ